MQTAILGKNLYRTDPVLFVFVLRRADENRIPCIFDPTDAVVGFRITDHDGFAGFTGCVPRFYYMESMSSFSFRAIRAWPSSLKCRPSVVYVSKCSGICGSTPRLL